MERPSLLIPERRRALHALAEATVLQPLQRGARFHPLVGVVLGAEPHLLPLGTPGGERRLLHQHWREDLAQGKGVTVAQRAHRHRQAGELSHGQKQWLEIGMLLAQEPKLLLIDEPAAGMTDQETADTADLLRDIARTKAVIVVEHDMTFVRDLGVKVTCLHEGAVLAEGPIDAVSADERVVEVYLGR